ncbi:uncharacterized protein LOC142612190 [Castanea sativa]|uniref:uncharacterized protein LOC142612190 n=1 Tax=Castanea sativa TaxID=21020 RepID=UPI003F64F07D
MDDIANKCAGLLLSNIEENEVDLTPPTPETGHVLVGKFYTKRRVSQESVARVMKAAWRIDKNFKVSDMGDNKVFIRFEDAKDLDRVLLLSPWSFDKYLVVLHKLGAGDTVNKLKFNRSSFWVQIHKLPTMNQTREAGLRIGGILGDVEKVDVDENGFCLGSYLRLRVSLDIIQPLCRGRRVRIGESVATWADFKYERLPIFCYWCGKLDHDERDCLQWIRSKETPRMEEKKFGPWLRAIPNRLQKPQWVVASNKSTTGLN